MSRPDRTRPDSWLAVDLGTPSTVDRMKLSWETAAGQVYKVQVSADGTQWTDVATFPRDDLRSTGTWLDVDGRAGFAVHGGGPIAVQGDVIVLSDGPAVPLTIEGYVGKRDLRVAAPVSSSPAIRASNADGFLTLFNLSAQETNVKVEIKQPRNAIKLYQGTQRTTTTGSVYETTQPAASSRVEPPRFTLKSMIGAVPAGVTATVRDGQRVSLTGPTAMLVLVQDGGMELPVLGHQEVVFPTGRPYPLNDLAAGRITFPASPLPAGMSDPAAAVDDDPRTAWTPGPGGRMVADLGGSYAIGEITLMWTHPLAPAATLELSTDGRTYQPAGSAPRGFRATVAIQAVARYVAVRTSWRPGQAALQALVVRPQ